MGIPARTSFRRHRQPSSLRKTFEIVRDGGTLPLVFGAKLEHVPGFERPLYSVGRYTYSTPVPSTASSDAAHAVGPVNCARHRLAEAACCEDPEVQRTQAQYSLFASYAPYIVLRRIDRTCRKVLSARRRRHRSEDVAQRIELLGRRPRSHPKVSIRRRAERAAGSVDGAQRRNVSNGRRGEFQDRNRAVVRARHGCSDDLPDSRCVAGGEFHDHRRRRYRLVIDDGRCRERYLAVDSVRCTPTPSAQTSRRTRIACKRPRQSSRSPKRPPPAPIKAVSGIRAPEPSTPVTVKRICAGLNCVSFVRDEVILTPVATPTHLSGLT